MLHIWGAILLHSAEPEGKRLRTEESADRVTVDSADKLDIRFHAAIEARPAADGKRTLLSGGCAGRESVARWRSERLDSLYRRCQH
jgi:hypothetical protein